MLDGWPLVPLVTQRSMAPCSGSMSQNLLLQATETQLVFGLSSIGNVMACINGSPNSR